MQKQFILYACPGGALAGELGTYFQQSLIRCGKNRAHDYMPHCTLTGFFHDTADAIPIYTHAVETALHTNRASLPQPVVEIRGMCFDDDFHYLKLESAWLETLAADFKTHAVSQTREEEIRLKNWLHLSLAYEFPSDQKDCLKTLATQYVNPTSPVEWVLRFYERELDTTWICHKEWAL